MPQRPYWLFFAAWLLAAPGGGEEQAAIQPQMLQAPSEVECFAIWEARLPAAAVGKCERPFCPASSRLEGEIFSPTGVRHEVLGFYYQEFARSQDKAGQEMLTPQGEPEWRVRFVPREIGEYKAQFFWGSGNKPARDLGALRFQAVKPQRLSPGFIGLSQDKRRFQHESGLGYFALGCNLCWVKPEEGTYAYDRYFAKMSAAGMNYARIWLCTWGINLETPQPYVFNLADAWRLEYILRQAEEKGIYIKLCLDNFYDFRHHFDKTPYAAKNGGPCRSRSDFFRSPAAKEMYKAKLRYLAARYGAFRSLLAWELWNEQNYALRYYDVEDENGWSITESRLRSEWHLPWVREMSAALRRWDGNHLITTSLGLHTLWPEFWQEPSLDFAQYHTYIHYLDSYRDELELDEVALVLAGASEICRFGKPGLLAEYGYLGEGEKSSLNDADPQGIALHNGIWASALSGTAGTAMMWWWDNYIEARDLYYHYRSLATFLADIDWRRSWTPMRVEDEAVRVVALRSSQQVLLWVQNRQNTWHRRIKKQEEPTPLADIVLSLRGFPAGVWRVEWFDTYRGNAITSYEVESRGDFKLRPPTFRFDIAARLNLLLPPEQR
ncbi:MAG: cellulase family glycosylhydrolase [Planctomycetota bacterium]|nr:cellulase family glycosylhydrolase [Planctomycetota bacterium]